MYSCGTNDVNAELKETVKNTHNSIDQLAEQKFGHDLVDTDIRCDLIKQVSTTSVLHQHIDPWMVPVPVLLLVDDDRVHEFEDVPVSKSRVHAHLFLVVRPVAGGGGHAGSEDDLAGGHGACFEVHRTEDAVCRGRKGGG